MTNLTSNLAWFVDALFYLGIILALVGGYMVVVPQHAMACNQYMNKWIATDSFFAELDRFRSTERYFYKWHRTLGASALICTTYILYQLLLVMELENIATVMPIVINHNANLWLYQSLFYFMTGVNFIILLLSIVFIVRPSAIKGVEKFFNLLFYPEKKLDGLNQQIEIPNHVLPGNIRLFGFIVMLGGLYMVYHLGPFID